MTRRNLGQLGTILLGLLPCLGCVTTSGVLPLAGTTSSPGPASPEPAGLPNEKAAQLCLDLARSLEQAGHDAEAAGQYELARHYNPQLDVSHRLAVLYDRLGNAAQAQAEFQHALEAHPRDPDLLNDLGYHYYNGGQWSEAERYLRQALDISPTHAPAWTNLGMTLAQEGRYPASLEAFQHCVGAAEAHCNLAFLLTAQGKHEQAKKEYQEALRLKPGLRLAQAALAKLEHAAQAPATSPREQKTAQGRATSGGPAQPSESAPIIVPALSPDP